MALVVVAVLFGLSLLGAFVLFAVLKGTAAVKKEEYQLGGAAAGFVVILSILSVTYMQLDNKKQQEKYNDLLSKLSKAQADAASGSTCLAAQASEVTYSGAVNPPVRNANVVLGVKISQLQEDGKFAIKVHNVKPADLPYIYVVGGESRAPYLQVFATDDPANLTISH